MTSEPYTLLASTALHEMIIIIIIIIVIIIIIIIIIVIILSLFYYYYYYYCYYYYYSERRALFLEHLKNNLGNEFEHFKNCDIAGKSHFILGTELWGSRFEELLRLVKSYIIDIWELRKSKLYGSGTGPLQYRSRPGRDTTCQGKGKFGKLGGEKSCIVVYGSARSSECEAHGPSATATI